VDLGDLAPARLAPLLPGRPLRSYPALLSTEADGQAWARAGAPPEAVVVADYQASPRGRAGVPWQVHPGRGLGLSLVLRPRLPPAREGWLYAVAALATAEVVGSGGGDGATIEWPDEVRVGGSRAAAVAVSTDVGATCLTWAVVSVVVEGVEPPRGPVLARVVEAVEHRLAEDPTVVLAQHRARCTTLGRRVRAVLVATGPSTAPIEGVAVDVLADGALLVETGRGPRVAVLPHHLAVLEDLGGSGGPAGGAASA
jgi:BirA family transcriptional regulator, biotin operon repressor / biotin---[acetyl-CoA-carboxylase] ligase